jgi:hypothetical protein
VQPARQKRSSSSNSADIHEYDAAFQEGRNIHRLVPYFCTLSSRNNTSRPFSSSPERPRPPRSRLKWFDTRKATSKNGNSIECQDQNMRAHILTQALFKVQPGVAERLVTERELRLFEFHTTPEAFGYTVSLLVKLSCELEGDSTQARGWQVGRVYFNAGSDFGDDGAKMTSFVSG